MKVAAQTSTTISVCLVSEPARSPTSILNHVGMKAAVQTMPISGWCVSISWPAKPPAHNFTSALKSNKICSVNGCEQNNQMHMMFGQHTVSYNHMNYTSAANCMALKCKWGISFQLYLSLVYSSGLDKWFRDKCRGHLIVPANEVGRGHRNGERPCVRLFMRSPGVSDHYLEKTLN